MIPEFNYNGKWYTVPEFMQETGLLRPTILYRLKNGLDPLNGQRNKFIDENGNEYKSLKKYCEATGKNYGTAKSRACRGLSVTGNKKYDYDYKPNTEKRRVHIDIDKWIDEKRECINKLRSELKICKSDDRKHYLTETIKKGTNVISAVSKTGKISSKGMKQINLSWKRVMKPK